MEALLKPLIAQASLAAQPSLADSIILLPPEDLLKLPGKRIPQLVTHAVGLQRQIESLKGRFENCKARLRAEAEAELRREGIKDLPGNAWTFAGADGTSARVNFPKDGLVKTFWLHDGEAYTFRDEKICKLGDIEGPAGKHFDKLFQKQFKPRKTLRELAPVLLAKKACEKLLRIIVEPSSPRVSFETKDKA